MPLNSSDEALEILEKALQELTKTTTLSSDTLKKINAALGKTTKAEEENADAVEKNTDTLKKLTKALTDATKSAVDIAQSVRDNREDFTSLNPAIEAAGTVLGSASNMLGSGMEAAGEAVSGLGKSSSKLGQGLNALGSVIKGFGKVTKAGGEMLSELGVAYGQFAMGELQNVVNAFREVGSVGAIGAQGMTGLYDQATQAGISINQFSKIVGENGQGLAMAAGSTEAGAKALSKMAEASKPFQREMLGLGYGIAEQREYQAKFMKYNRLVGQIDVRNDKEMAAASKGYMENLDMLSRLTGKSRDELAKEMEDRLQSVRYQATLQVMEEQYGKDVRKEIDNTASLLRTYIPDAAKGFEEGWMNSATEAGQMFEQQFGEVGVSVREGLKSGKLQAADAAIMLRDELVRRQKDMLGGAEGAARLMDMTGSYDQVIKAMQQAKTAQNLTREEMAKALQSQGAAKKATDKTTGEVIDAQESLQQMTNDMDKIVKTHVLPNAASLVKSYSGALERFIKWANKTLGEESTTGGGAAAAGGGAAEPTGMEGFSDAGPSAGGGTAAATAGAVAGGAVTGSTQQILETIKSKESSGNYQAQARGSSASGAYQFIDSTWQSLTKKYGIGGEFARAGDAPPQVQDAVAAKYVEDILKKTGGDVSKVPNVWYTGNVEGRMSEKALAANRGQTAADYQSKWMAAFNKAGGSATVAPTTIASSSSPRDQAYRQEMARMDDQEARLQAARERVWEARKQLAYKNPNGKVIVQNPGEPWAANGGVFSGPKSGYNATLHGNEAVVPLPSGDKIPVEMGGISESIDTQVSLMTDQIGRLDELVKLLRTGADISNKMLRVAQV